MQNKIWEQVGQFLNRLRCENVARDTAVEVPVKCYNKVVTGVANEV